MQETTPIVVCGKEAKLVHATLVGLNEMIHEMVDCDCGPSPTAPCGGGGRLHHLPGCPRARDYHTDWDSAMLLAKQIPRATLLFPMSDFPFFSLGFGVNERMHAKTPCAAVCRAFAALNGFWVVIDDESGSVSHETVKQGCV